MILVGDAPARHLRAGRHNTPLHDCALRPRLTLLTGLNTVRSVWNDAHSQLQPHTAQEIP